MSVESIDPQALVDALRERGEGAAADAVVSVLLEARAVRGDAGAAEAQGVMGALQAARERGDVSQWYAA